MKTKLRRNGIKIMASLMALVGSFALVIVLAVINGLLGYLCALGVSLFGAMAVAKILSPEVISLFSFNWLIALCVGCGVLRGLLRYFEQYSNHYIAFKLLAIIRDKVFKALRVLCPAKLESKKKGSIIAMITSDIEALEVFYAHTISPICIAFFMCLGVFLFVGLFSSWYLALLALLAYLTVGILLPLISSKVLEKPGVVYRREFASFNSYFLDSIKGIREIIVHNNGKVREKEVDERSSLLLKETKKMKLSSAKFAALTELIVGIFLLLATALGILLVYFDGLNVGKMVVGLVAIFGSFGPVIALSALPANLTQTFASGDRILNLLEETPAVTPIKNGKTFAYEDLKVENLAFAYPEGGGALEEVNFSAKKGEIVGIIGESGSGKSTFLKLLLRFWEKNDGSILYNGTDVDEIDSDSLLDNVTMVSQSTYLFDDTIEGNLRIAKPDATLEELRQACKLASIDEFISSLPEGYQTKVGQMGDNLSAGEKQRIGLARAFLKGSELILLDEPTSNVDAINEGMILSSLAKMKNKKSIILVSHRESTMALADRVYRIENGHMKEVTQ